MSTIEGIWRAIRSFSRDRPVWAGLVGGADLALGIAWTIFGTPHGYWLLTLPLVISGLVVLIATWQPVKELHADTTSSPPPLTHVAQR
jgi:hypothetical protein